MEELFDELLNENNKKIDKKDRVENFCEIYGSPQDNMFLIYYKKFIPTNIANKFFELFEQHIQYNSVDQSKIKIFGKSYEIPRKQVAYGEKGTFYNFSGIKVDAIDWNQDTPLCNALIKIKLAVSKHFGYDFNFVLINRYADGNDHIGYHADDEDDLFEMCPIVGVSFGAEREFKFKNSASGENFRFGKKTSLVLNHGSCLSIQYPTNKFWKHSLPKRVGIKSPRVSLTFRVMKSITN